MVPPVISQVSPDAFVLVAGALTELLVSFRPVTSGSKDIKVQWCGKLVKHGIIVAFVTTQNGNGRSKVKELFCLALKMASHLLNIA
jgi:hypothetical protein